MCLFKKRQISAIWRRVSNSFWHPKKWKLVSDWDLELFSLKVYKKIPFLLHYLINIMFYAASMILCFISWLLLMMPCNTFNQVRGNEIQPSLISLWLLELSFTILQNQSIVNLNKYVKNSEIALHFFHLKILYQCYFVKYL